MSTHTSPIVSISKFTHRTSGTVVSSCQSFTYTIATVAENTNITTPIHVITVAPLIVDVVVTANARHEEYAKIQ